MRVFGFPEGGPQIGHHRDIENVISALGTPHFDRALFSLSLSMMRCEHVTAYVFPRDKAPICLAAINAGETNDAKYAAGRYSKHYWQQDPANKPIQIHKGCGELIAIRSTGDDIIDAAYRHECYTSVGIAERCTFARPFQGHSVRLNFYRSRRLGPFSDGEIDNMRWTSGIAFSALQKHAHLLPHTRHLLGEGTYRTRLAIVSPTLPERETEVCIGIIRGVSSEGIALSLGISINTVLTYRKRAYTRLGITSQNELMKLVLD